MMNRIFVNVGNTHSVFAKWENNEFVRVLSLGTRISFSALPDFPPDTFFFVASVVPEKNKLFPPERTRFIGVKDAGIPHLCPEIGADRVANLIAARECYGNNSWIVDIGTCITFEGVDAKGNIAGGAILPGRRLQHEALANFAAQLPNVPLAETLPKEMAFDTTTAIQIGTDGGLLGAMNHLIALVNHTDTHIIVTGGDAPFFLDAMPYDHYEPDLTLQGIRIWADQTSHN